MKPDWIHHLLKKAWPYLLAFALFSIAWSAYRYWYVYLPPTGSPLNLPEHRALFEQETGIAVTSTVVLLHRFHDESRGPDFMVWYVFSRKPVAFEPDFFYEILPDPNDDTYPLVADRSNRFSQWAYERMYQDRDMTTRLTIRVGNIEKFIRPLRIREPISSGRADRVRADRKLTVVWIKARTGYYYGIEVQLAQEGQPFIEKQ